LFHKLGCEGAPFLPGFVLGPLMEENVRRSMMLSFGDFLSGRSRLQSSC
jgi:putative tricarboxylic transport membrane protein